MEEHDLIARIRKDDEKAFETLFRKYFQDLLNYAGFYIGDKQLAEDIVQDIFLKLWRSRRSLNIKISIRGYLIKWIHNECISFLRHETARHKHSEVHRMKLREAQIMNRLFSETGLNLLFEKEIDVLVLNALEKLPDQTRRIYLLSRDQHLTNKEIAKSFHLTEKSIEYHITRALELLRIALKDYLVVFLATGLLFPFFF